MALTCALLGGGSWLLFSALRAREEAALGRQLAGISQESVHLLQTKLERSIEILHGIVSLFEVEPDVSREQFARFVGSALGRQPEIKALEWIPRVPEVERGTFEQSARDGGHHGFQFTERQGEILVRARARDEYFPVYFLEPMLGNEAALGFDLAASGERRRALEAARDSGRSTATGPVRLAQDSEERLGFLVFVPVYRPLAPGATVADRRDRLLGFALAVFRMGDLLGPTLRALAERGLAVAVFDRVTGRRLAGEPVPPLLAAGIDAALDVAGRPWVVRFAPTAAFRARQSQGQAGWVLAAGLVLTALVVAYIWSDLRRRDGIEQSNRALQAEIAVRKQAEERAAAASRAKSVFLADMSHEIRTPLNAILGYSQILERDPHLPRAQREAVETISSSGRHLLGLVNEILDLGKIEQGSVERRTVDFDLGALLSEIASLFEQRCREKRLAFRLEGAPSTRTLVSGDLMKLRQVLINLVGNAVKFTNTGEVVLRTQAVDRERRRFEVTDTGVGISPEQHEEVFLAFRQGRQAGDVRSRGGTGLGLTIARAHVELMGGRLELASRPGEGSTFAFEIPLPPPYDWAQAEPPTAAAPRALPGRLRTLVVDDVAENRLVLARMLEELGCEVALAVDGGEALRSARTLVAEGAPLVVFLDVRLPDQDGRDVARALRQLGAAAIHLVAHSASAFAHQREEYLHGGFDDFLAKPVSFQSLERCLRALPASTWPAPVAPPSLPPMAVASATSIPQRLRSRLTEAARLHNATEIRRCLRELEALGPAAAALGGEIARALRRYDMDAVLQLPELRDAGSCPPQDAAATEVHA